MTDELWCLVVNANGVARVLGPAREAEIMMWRYCLRDRNADVETIRWSGDILEYDAEMDLK